jgi:two-component system response regulator YesN
MTASAPRRSSRTTLSRTPVLAAIATAPSSAMTMRERKPRTFTHAHRQRLDRAIAHYLDQCYASRSAARVSEFAAFLERNPEYMTRTAVSIVGVPLREYLRTRQLEEAERLIVTTPLPMREIALHAGFGTTSTFYRCFKQAHNMTPGAFREVRK